MAAPAAKVKYLAAFAFYDAVMSREFKAGEEVPLHDGKAPGSGLDAARLAQALKTKTVYEVKAVEPPEVK